MGKIAISAAPRQEPSVTIPYGASFVAPQAAGSSNKAILWFASLTQNPNVDARTQLLNWDGTSGGFMTQFDAGAGQCGLRARIADSNGVGIIQSGTPISIGNKYLVLYSGFIDSGNTLHSIGYIFNGTAWVEAFNATDTSAPGATLNLGAEAWELFKERGSANQYWAGDVNRFAVWLGTSNAAIADITSASVRGLFASRSKSAGPRASVASLGTPVIDLNSTAQDYQSGVHSGSWASLIKAGTQISEPVVTEDPPIIQDDPTWDGTLAAGEIISFTAASASGTQPITDTLSAVIGGMVASTGDSYTITEADLGKSFVLRQESSNDFGSDIAQSEPVTIPLPTPSDTTRPVVDIATAGSDSGGVLPLTVSCTERDSRPVVFRLVAVTANASAPSVAQVKAGQNASGAATQSASWTSSGASSSPTAALSASLTAGTYDLYVVATDDAGNDTAAVKLIEDVAISATVTSLSIALTITDTTPIITTPGNLSYTITARDGPSGDIIEFTLTGIDSPPDGWECGWVEWRIDDGAGGYITGGTVNDDLGKTMIIRGLSEAVNAVEVRQVNLKHNCLRYRNVKAANKDIRNLVNIGDTLRHSNGSTCEVVEFINPTSGDYADRQIIVDNMVGYFPGDNDNVDDEGNELPDAGTRVFLNDTDTVVLNMGKQPVLPKWFPDEATEVSYGAWQTAVEVTTAIGTPTVECIVIDGKTTITEGEAITLKAIPHGFNTTLPRGELVYRWSVVTAGNTATAESLFAWHLWGRELSTGESPNWAHRPITTGTVQYQCEVWHPADYAGRQTGTVSITVTPKATTFSAANTYAVYSTTYTGPTASNTYTDIDAAITAIKAGGGTGRLILERGQTYSPANLDFRNTATTNFCIDTWGSGARPVLENATLRLGGQARTIIEGIKISNGYDSSAPDDVTARPPDAYLIDSASYTTLYRCECAGVNYGFRFGLEGNTTILIDTIVDDMMEFAWYGTTVGSVFIIASRAMHNAGCWRSQGKGDVFPPFTANHAALRMSRNRGDRVIENCYVASFATWSDNGSVQPCMRLFGSMPIYQWEVDVRRMVVLGGVFAISPSTGGSMPTATDLVMDKIYIQALQCDQVMFNLSTSGVYCKNMMFVTEATNEEFNNGLRFPIGLTFGDDLGPWRQAHRSHRILTNISVINLKSVDELNDKSKTWNTINVNNDERWPGLQGGDVVANLLAHSPNYPGGTSAGNFDTTGQWTPYYQGFFRYDFTEIVVSNGDTTGYDPSKNIFDGFDADITVTSSSGGSGRMKWMKNRSDNASWAAGNGTGTLMMNATTTGTFSPGDTLTFSDGTSATVVSYTLGTYDNGGAQPNTAHTSLSTGVWRPQSGNVALAAAPEDSKALLPYDDLYGDVRRRDGTSAWGAVESV